MCNKLKLSVVEYLSNWPITAKRFKRRPDFSNCQFQSQFVLLGANLPLREYPQVRNLQDGENVAPGGRWSSVFFSPHARLEPMLLARLSLADQLSTCRSYHLNHKVFFWVLLKWCLSKAKLLRVTDREISFVCMHVVRSCFLSHPMTWVNNSWLIFLGKKAIFCHRSKKCEMIWVQISSLQIF